MSAGSITHQDLEHRKQSVISCAITNVNSNHRTELRTYIHINPTMTVHSMYLGKVVGLLYIRIIRLVHSATSYKLTQKN